VKAKKHTMKLIGSSIATILILSAFGCATTAPPQELIDARIAYSRAQTGPAKALMPADLETARQALDKAEQAYKDDADSAATKEFSYVASRKVLLAEARGRTAENEKARSDADTAFKSVAENKLDNKNAALSQTAQALALEQQRRAEAEKRVKDALDRLSALAAVKEDTRGTVITLSGSVLFATNKSDLLPGASERLNQVAEALKERPERAITVFGYTDSQGDASYNQTLSEKRAASVRQYLVEHGVPADHVKALGKGKGDPIADNASAEGRANNRRVEIVIGPADGSSPSTTK
jgi:outer membrane protein OmpA-like peptidoglycan-associated protein